MNKRADMEGSKAVFYIVFGLAFVATCIALISIISAGDVQEAAIPPGLEEFLLVQRLLNSKDCLAYQDPLTLRVYPAVIDPAKLSDEQLERCTGKAVRIGMEGKQAKSPAFVFPFRGREHDVLLFMDGGFIAGRVYIEHG
ncbi:MAG TPA: hypothetical protein VJC16_02075 [Candidatus Nanoarchaeia archaeon]|nr:hypothetical protein [Candidatus Nanoarchaeia archaeon]